jgi:hypothetical protein
MTEPLTFLHPELTAELEPSCEWYTLDLATGLIPTQCSNPAAWCLRTTCTDCGRPDIQLVCHPHRDYINAGRSLAYCPDCGQVPARFTHVEQRLR